MTLRWDTRSRVSTLVQSWMYGVTTDPIYGAFESIATYSTTLNGLNTITFSSIPQTYKHLQIRTSTISTTDGYIQGRFNSDSGSNYAWHILTGQGSAASSGASTSQTNLRITGYNNQNDSTNPYVSITDILDYKDTNKYKTIRTLAGKDSNGAGDVMLISGVWMSTSAVTAIEFYLGSTSAKTFATGSHIALYGIRG